MQRRNFIQLGGVAAGAFAFASPVMARQSGTRNTGLPAGNDIKFSTDGLSFSPLEYSQLLLKLSQEGRIKADTYSLGGAVEELEQKFASILGKESAVFMPTGTLANQLALRKLAGDNKR